MKKILLLISLFTNCVYSIAQYRFTATVNTATSNEFIQLPSAFLEAMANVILSDEVSGDKILFAPQFIFPFSIRNNAPDEFGEMRSGYARAFSTPWKHLGDYELGLTGSWDHYDKPFGFYLGISYKSHEVAFKESDLNDRAHYVSPEVGVRLKLGSKQGLYLQMGTSYDYVFNYKGEMHNYEKDAVNSGLTLNFGVGQWTKNGHFQLNFKLPMYNFYNKDYTPDKGLTYPFKDVNRSIGFISLIFRNMIEY